MQIPSERIIRKMEQELQQLLKGTNEKELRERVLIIRSLCDVLLEEQGSPLLVQENTLPVMPSQTLPTYIEQKEPTDSLLDF